ncbi:hypothetical protein E2C01_065716 [Portunus trituberculatus]|uniref:Uncharacterized protein n=1 Tax=Portunus trituberculatus TaxID=210409 RepID=A0A5B7HP21_PORTR|nr:hypothetical protein [Portunus trituberculatus]
MVTAQTLYSRHQGGEDPFMSRHHGGRGLGGELGGWAVGKEGWD